MTPSWCEEIISTKPRWKSVFVCIFLLFGLFMLIYVPPRPYRIYISYAALSLPLRFNGHFPGEPGLAGVYWSKGWWRWWWQLDYWSYKPCKASVKSSPPTNQHPIFYRLDALPVAQPTVSKHWRLKVPLNSKRTNEKHQENLGLWHCHLLSTLAQIRLLPPVSTARFITPKNCRQSF